MVRRNCQKRAKSSIKKEIQRVEKMETEKVSYFKRLKVRPDHFRKDQPWKSVFQGNTFDRETFNNIQAFSYEINL